MKREEIMNLFEISGKVALVTGATGALGSTASKTFAACGAKVIMTARNSSLLKNIKEEIEEDGGEAIFVAADPTNYEDVERVIKAGLDKFGSIDILVTAAGINNFGPIHIQSKEEWQMVLNVNVIGTYYFCREVGKVMMEKGGGKIILIGSVRGDVGLANYTAYCSSKAAIHLLTKSLACEFGPYKINVNCIAPGVFRSGITRHVFENPDFMQRILPHFPIGRLGEPEDFIGALLFLASKASDWMTGAIIHIDGGYTAG